MQPDLLQQLRDVHLPEAPGWWPPAPGWWLLLLLALAGLVLVVRAARRAYLRRQPFRHARRLYAQLHSAYTAGTLSENLYLHQSNELLKRLVIFGLGDDQARKANDQEWLAILDRWSGSNAFTSGAGQALGNQRFAPAPQADMDALHALLLQFFAKAHP